MSLIADAVSFAYDDDHEVLRNVSLSVDPRERVALVAPSGRGKTTLCRMLAGYLSGYQGSVTVDGVDISLMPRRQARPVQLIWQHPEQAFDPRMRMQRSLQEAGFDLHDPHCSELAERFGLNSAWFMRYPGELSGGELMRFCLVRALCTNPRYLICDEISAMLDVVTQAQIWHELIDISSACNMGLLIVSHVPALLDRVATSTVDLA